MAGNKYIRRANLQYALILLIVIGIGLYMSYNKSEEVESFGQPPIVEEIIESIPSDLP